MSLVSFLPSVDSPTNKKRSWTVASPHGGWSGLFFPSRNGKLGRYLLIKINGNLVCCAAMWSLNLSWSSILNDFLMTCYNRLLHWVVDEKSLLISMWNNQVSRTPEMLDRAPAPGYGTFTHNVARKKWEIAPTVVTLAGCLTPSPTLYAAVCCRA